MRFRVFGVILGGVLALTFAAFAPRAQASEMNQSTRLTFNRSIELPGNVVLPAGTYWFQIIPDMPGSDNFVRVLNSDRTKLYATLHTITTEGWYRSDNTQLTIAEPSRNNQPVAVMNWFYPGEIDHDFGTADLLIGHQFVYPQAQERRLAEEKHITVTVNSNGLVPE